MFYFYIVIWFTLSFSSSKVYSVPINMTNHLETSAAKDYELLWGLHSKKLYVHQICKIYTDDMLVSVILFDFRTLTFDIRSFTRRLIFEHLTSHLRETCMMTCIRITEAETSKAHGCSNFSARSYKNIDILCRLYTLPVVGYTCNFLMVDGMGEHGSAKKNTSWEHEAPARRISCM